MKKIHLLNLLKLSSILTFSSFFLISCDSDSENPITSIEETEQFLSLRSLVLQNNLAEPTSILNGILFNDGGQSYIGLNPIFTTTGASTYAQTGNLGSLQLDDQTIGAVTITLTFDTTLAGQYEAVSITSTETGTFTLSENQNPFSEGEITTLEEQFIGLTEEEAFDLAEEQLLEVRISQIDGISPILTTDFIASRINLIIVNDIVTAISFG